MLFLHIVNLVIEILMYPMGFNLCFYKRFMSKNVYYHTMSTDKQIILTDSGNQVEATAPVIISASRSTDIPAFYAKWFFNRLAKGYCVWVNPFNRQRMYVSFKRCKVVVFWTKNPEPILPYLSELDKRGIADSYSFYYATELAEPDLEDW